MNIAVMGAGAVGCYYGGMLARAGHEVVLIGRDVHVEAILRAGLLFDTQTSSERVPVRAVAGPEGVRDAHVVLFSVKSTDTESAAAAMAPYLARDACVLSLQNGVDNAERLQSALPGHDVRPVVVYVAAEMAGPGHVRHHGRGELLIGPGPRTDTLVALFGAAGIQVEVSDDVTGALWTKLVLNCAYNALSAITKLPYGKLVQGMGVETVMRDVVNECLAVGHAAGVSLQGDVWQAVQRIAQTMPRQFSSTAQDLARGKPSEIDHLNGYIVRRGEALGVDVRTNRVLWVTVKLLEASERAADAGASDARHTPARAGSGLGD